MKDQTRQLAKSAGGFVIDYMQRHRHPVNAALHLVGVPAVFYGIFCAASGRSGKSRALGLGLIVFGYALQYVGHKQQGNEVGEVSLIKFLVQKIREAGRKRLSNYNWQSNADEAGGRARQTAGARSGARSGGGNGNGTGNGNGHHGDGHSQGAGRYILWWKTSH